MEDIILTGPKHSGKTSTGKALALICSCDFIDLDELILQRTGKSPRQLYNESPAIFQKAEAETIATLFKTGFVGWNSDGSYGETEGRRVIATGGGIIDNAEATAALKKPGAVTVCLDISAESAWDRIANAPGGELPPFLRTENPRETHRVLHERRAAAYLQFADVVIDAEGKTPEEIAKEIKNRLHSDTRY
ncbi:MAG: shikimate kinase [Treponema sp.]|nr:shikimate kinase [Treponema sp.]